MAEMSDLTKLSVDELLDRIPYWKGRLYSRFDTVAEIRRRLEAAEQLLQVAQHKHFDPDCALSGCKSLKLGEAAAENPPTKEVMTTDKMPTPLVCNSTACIAPGDDPAQGRGTASGGEETHVVTQPGVESGSGHPPQESAMTRAEALARATDICSYTEEIEGVRRVYSLLQSLGWLIPKIADALMAASKGER